MIICVRMMTRSCSIPAPIALIVLAMASAGCQRAAVEEVQTTAVVPVAVEEATVGVLQGTITATGIVAAAPGAELIVVAPAPARIAALPHAEGDSVKAGDVLVRFDIPSLTADVEANRSKVTQAAARVEAAKASVARLKSLLDQGVAAPKDVEEATRQLAESQGDLEQSRSAVQASVALSARAVVRAPFAGVIAQRQHNPGDLVEAASSDPVLKIINPAQLQVVAAIPASELSRIVIGRPAQIREPGHDDSEDAKVLTKAAQIDPATATGNVRLGFLKPTSLTAGLTVQVEIVGEERRNALIIPASALVDDEGELFVMVAGADNKAHKYPVAVGLSTRTQTEVKSGIKAGDRVIVRGQDGLPEGAAVTVESK
jgi:membrane fusion protein, multidrug efflux system